MSILPKAAGVYVITHTPSGREYVGSTTNLRRRAAEHLSNLRCGLHRSTLLQDDFDRDGAEAFGIGVLAISSIEYAHDLESRYLAAYAKVDTHYNTRVVPGIKALRGAEQKAEMSRRNGRVHRHHTEAAKKRIGDASRGKVNSPETRARMSASQTLRFALHPLSAESKELARLALIGRPQSQETRAKRSATLLAYNQQRRLMGIPHVGALTMAHYNATRGPMSAETRAKLSAAQRLAWARRKERDS
jgi:group I intron endonuclease